MHLHSFQSLQMHHDEDETNESHSVTERRSGIQIYGRGKSEDEMTRYFQMLNEAITEELTERFAKEHLENIPGIEEGMKTRERLSDGIDRFEMFTTTHIHKLKNRGNKKHYKLGTHYGYKEPRDKLSAAIDEIYQKNTEHFSSKEDVFAVFARAYFTGRILPVARLVDDTFGAGTFVDTAKRDGEAILREHASYFIKKGE